MDVISYTQARHNLARTMDRVREDCLPMRITRPNGPDAVLISAEHYAALEETAYLLRSPANARRLAESLGEIRRGGGQERELIDEAGLLSTGVGRLPALGRHRPAPAPAGQRADP